MNREMSTKEVEDFITSDKVKDLLIVIDQSETGRVFLSDMENSDIELTRWWNNEAMHAWQAQTERPYLSICFTVGQGVYGFKAYKNLGEILSGGLARGIESVINNEGLLMTTVAVGQGAQEIIKTAAKLRPVMAVDLTSIGSRESRKLG